MASCESIADEFVVISATSAPEVRVLHVCGRMKAGGITRFVESLLEMNGIDDVQHDLLVTFRDGPAPRSGNWTTHQVDCRAGRLLRGFQATVGVLRGYDVVMLHAAHPIVVLALLLQPRKSFLFQHGMTVSSGARPVRALKKLWFSTLPSLLDAGVVCSTEYAFQKSRALGIRLKREQAVIVPFGTAFERMQRNASPTQRTGVITIGIAGRLVPQKRTHVVLESLQAYRGRHPIEVLIAGEGPEHTRLAHLAATLPAGVHVEFLGTVADMASFYDRLDVLAFPASGESLGLVVLEAMRRSVPVAVVRDVGGCLPFVVDGETGFVLPDPTSYAELWHRLDQAPDELTRLARTLVSWDHPSAHLSRTRAILGGLSGQAQRPGEANL